MYALWLGFGLIGEFHDSPPPTQMLPSQYIARFDDLDKLMNPTQNFKLYREEVRQVDGPAIPYFGTHCPPSRASR
jgi:hypothetical protein